MVGAAKALFLPLSLAVGFSMVASYLLSSTLVPILSVWVLRGHEQARDGPWRRPRAVSPDSSERYAALGAADWCDGAGWWSAALSGGDGGSSLCFVGRAAGDGDLPPGRCRTASSAAARAGRHADRRHRSRRAAGAGPDQAGGRARRTSRSRWASSACMARIIPINLIYLWNGGPEEGVVQVQLKPGAPIRIEELKERLRRSLRASRCPTSAFPSSRATS